MRGQKAIFVAALVGLVASRTAHAAPVYDDTFFLANAYSDGTSGAYTVADENNAAQSRWTSGSGILTYSRANTSRDPAYNYESSVILTSGSTPDTGCTAGLTHFTVASTIYDIPSVNTAQPGLIIGASLGSGPVTGGYLLEVDNGQNKGPGGPFALVAETSSELLGDEGNGEVVQNFGIPVTGHDYNISATVDRSATNPAFTVVIQDLTSNSTFYSGTFIDPENTSDFGGTQIGFRVRDPLDSEMPSFGPLSLSVPEPGPRDLVLLATATLILRRRARNVSVPASG